MMSLNKTQNVPVHQPEDNPLKNICTTIKPVGGGENLGKEQWEPE